MFEGVPAMYAMLLASPALPGADLTSLRVCTVGGQTISTATIGAWQERSGAPLIELWGMTEIAGLGTTHARQPRGDRQDDRAGRLAAHRTSPTPTRPVTSSSSTAGRT
jgi:long-chain acyl-CoA synthetase